MYCPNCGAKNQDMDMFCGECGTSLAEYQEEIPAEQVMPDGTPLMQPQQATPLTAGTPEKIRKPLSKRSIILICQIILAFVLIAAISILINKKYAPETIAMNYWKAVMAGEWSEAYSYCSMPKDSMLSEQNYVNAHAQEKEGKKYKSASISEDNLETKDNSIRYYVIEYLQDGSSEKSTQYLTLTKQDKKFLIWDQWEVVPSEEWITDVEFYVPEEATLTINGQDIAEAAQNEPLLVTIPYLFCGDYQIEVSAEGMETYKEGIAIDSISTGSYEFSLRPSEETIENVAAQFETDFIKVLENAFAQEKFSTVSDSFSKNSLENNYIKDNYEDLVEIADDENMQSLAVTNLEYSVSCNENNEIYIKGTMEIEEKYTSYWSDDIQTKTRTGKFECYYEKEEGAYKLARIPVTYYSLFY